MRKSKLVLHKETLVNLSSVVNVAGGVTNLPVQCNLTNAPCTTYGGTTEVTDRSCDPVCIMQSVVSCSY